MKSPPVVLQGSQRPSVLTRPKFSNEDAGQEAIDLAASVGLMLDPWQQLVVRVALAEDSRGLYASREVGYLVARQQGKGGVLEAIALHGLFLVGDPLTLWTAHQTKTAFEGFLRLRGWIDGSDELRKRVKSINAAHGEEGFVLQSGARLRFLARSKSSGRGFSPQRIFFDEAQELAKVAAEAMLPSMRAQRNRQAIYTGTVPGPEINNPEHWTRLRDRGRAGEPRLAWAEWSPRGSHDPDVDIDLDDRKHWVSASPGMGYRPGMTWELLEADRQSLSDDSFARECLCVWPTMPDLDMDAAFGKGMWQACDTDVAPARPIAVGIAVSVDRKWAAIGAASVGDVPHLGSYMDSEGLPSKRLGTAWVVAEAKRLQDKHDCAVVVDSKGPAETLIDKLVEAGVTVMATTTDEYVGACADLFDAVQAAAVSHGEDELLNDSVGRAETRKVGDRWAWARRAGDISMLEAVTLAHWGAGRVHDYDLLDSIF